MCTTARMTYILTYRALRECASGRKSVNPIEAMHKLETAVPYSVCAKTHTVMMLAQRSFNQRYLAPVDVHEPLFTAKPNRIYNHQLGASTLRNCSDKTIHARLTFMRQQTFTRRVYGIRNVLGKVARWERMIKRGTDLPLFA